MIGVNDFERIKRRYQEFWALENHDAPLYKLTGVKNINQNHEPPVSLEQRWLDEEYIIRSARKRMENCIYAGVSFPVLCADLGPDILGAVIGDEIEFGENTSFAKHLFTDVPLSDIDLKFDENNKWWKKIDSMLKTYINDAKGDYIVGFADWHGGNDALVSLIGPERLCMELYDNPDEVKRLNNQLFEIFKTIMNRSYSVTKPHQEGTTHWLSLWHPGLWYNTSCDFNIVLSADMFEEFVIPPLEKDLSFLEKSIYHLDGPGAFRHLDRLLELNNLHGIQLVYGAGAPPALHWLPELKRIQAKGKSIDLICQAHELPTLLSELKPEGLHLNIQPDWDSGKASFTADEVADIVRLIEKG